MKHSLSLPAFLLVMSLAASVPAAITDFRIPEGAEFSVGGTPGRLAVTPDDRFVLILDETNKAVKVLDTWNFAILPGSISLSATATPVSIAIAPDGNTAYVTMTDKKISKLDISGLPDLGLNETLSITPTPMDLTFTDPLGDIRVLPLQGSTPPDSCVFVIDGDSLEWFQAGDTAPTLTNITPNNCQAREVEGAGKYAHLLCDDRATSVNATLYQFDCIGTGAHDVTVAALTLGASGAIRGLSLAADQEWLLAGDTTSQDIILIDSEPSTVGTDTVGRAFVNTTLQDILSTDFASDNPLGFVLGSDTLTLLEMDTTPDTFAGDTVLPLPILGGGYLARSSPEDQYVYLSLAGGDTVAVVTANPWVEISSATLTPGDTTGQGTLNITFTASLLSGSTAKYEIKKATAFKAGTAITNGTGTLSDGETVTKTLELTGLTEGQNVISVEVTASSRTGRDAAAITGGCAVTPVNFSLDFGTEKLIVQFKGLNCSNIERYEIYYGTNCGVDVLDYASIDDPGGDGRPPSPIILDNPDPGEEIREVVEGLQNGETYCVQIVTVDDSGNKVASVRKSILVEKALTLTDLADEDGGYDCFGIGSGAGFWGSGAWLAAAPLGLLGLIKAVRKWRRRR